MSQTRSFVVVALMLSLVGTAAKANTVAARLLRLESTVNRTHDARLIERIADLEKSARPEHRLSQVSGQGASEALYKSVFDIRQGRVHEVNFSRSSAFNSSYHIPEDSAVSRKVTGLGNGSVDEVLSFGAGKRSSVASRSFYTTTQALSESIRVKRASEYSTLNLKAVAGGDSISFQALNGGADLGALALPSRMRGEIVHFDVLPTTNANNFEVVIWSWENGPAGPKNHITVPVTRNAETGRLSANWDRSRLRPLTLDEISNAKATREVIPALPERKGGGNPFGATN